MRVDVSGTNFVCRATLFSVAGQLRTRLARGHARAWGSLAVRRVRGPESAEMLESKHVWTPVPGMPGQSERPFGRA